MTGKGAICSHKHHDFQSLDSLIGEIHQLFSNWLSDSPFGNEVSRETILWTKVAVHEWMANLVQHARFDGLSPKIRLSIWADKNRLCVRIEDNSDGFALSRKLHGSLQQAIDKLPERGMGLLMLKESADELIYQRGRRGTQNGVCVAVRAVTSSAEDNIGDVLGLA